MTLWLDAQLSPALARWIDAHFADVTAVAVRDLGLRDAEDPVIFDAARNADAVVVTKDRDFVELLGRLGPPPKIVWVRLGNTSNARMQSVLISVLPTALSLLRQGESLVEVR